MYLSFKYLSQVETDEESVLDLQEKDVRKTVVLKSHHSWFNRETIVAMTTGKMMLFVMLVVYIAIYCFITHCAPILSTHTPLGLAFLISILSSFCSASGYCLQRRAQSNVDTIAAMHWPVYFAGLACLGTGTIGAVYNLKLLGQGVQAPFAAMTLIANAVLGHWCLNEPYTRVDAVSTGLIISGVMVAMTGAQLSPQSQSKDIQYLPLGGAPLVYTVSCVFTGSAFYHYVIRHGLERQPIGLITLSLVAGGCAGFTSLFVKTVLHWTGTVGSPWNPQCWIAIVGIALALSTQMYVLAHGLRHHNAIRFIPLYQAAIILSNLCCGNIFFHEARVYSWTSILVFVLGCSITLVGVMILVLKETPASRPSLPNRAIYSQQEQTLKWIPSDQIEVLMDVAQCGEKIVELFQDATESIYFSTFLSDFRHPLPLDKEGLNTTCLFDLIRQAVVQRHVRVHILYNPIMDYGTTSLEELRLALPVEVELHVKTSDCGPNAITKILGLSSNSKYGFHHQKYLMIDHGKKTMITGCDVNEERTPWLTLNEKGYYWHEIGIVTHHLPSECVHWIQHNHDLTSVICHYESHFESVPSPLVNGGLNEEQIIVDMILSAKFSIHIENQIFITGGHAQSNRVGEAIVERLVQNILREGHLFQVLIVTNDSQDDEPSLCTQWYCRLSVAWSRLEIEQRILARGCSLEQLYSRLAMTKLQYQGKPIKVHSNVVIQDSWRALRSSSNCCDRCLTARPCDTELGLLIEGLGVIELQQHLWNRYFGSEDVPWTMADVIERLNHPITSDKTSCIELLPRKFTQDQITRIRLGFQFFAQHPAAGGHARVKFAVENYPPGEQPENKVRSEI